MKWITLFGLALSAVACGNGSAQRAENGTAAGMTAALESGDQPQGIIARRLTSADDILNPWRSTFSPDGRFQVIPEWNTQILAIRDLETGSIRQVSPEDSPEDGQEMVFSSDGAQIAFSQWHEDHWVLRTIATAGGEARTLFDPATRGAYNVVPFDWSPDDSAVLAGVAGGKNWIFELVTVSTSDGSVHSHKRGSDFRVPNGRAFFSPDGRYVAYSAYLADSDAMSDVWVLALESGHEERVLSGPSDDQVLGWNEEGRWLYVMSDRAGSPSLWALPVADGARNGDPKLLRREVHGFLSGHVAGGKLLYHIVTEYPKLYTMGLDLETGDVLSEPVAEESGGTVRIENPAWSPDGQFLAYARGNEPQTIVVRAGMGNHLREFVLPPGFLSVETLRWTPDSRSLVMAAGGGANYGSSSVLRLTLSTGDFEVGPNNPAESWPLSPDGLKVYRSSNGRVQEWDLTTGEIDVLWEVPDRDDYEGCWPGLPVLSPSGRQLALVAGCIGIMPTDGGEPTWIYTPPPDERGAWIPGDGRASAWTADGSSVLFVKNVPGQDGLKELWTIPATGGSPRKLDTFHGVSGRFHDSFFLGPALIAAHPDNRHIAFMSSEERYELWGMEGLEEALRE
jgi:Tol biopolymer transport system component